MTISKRDAKLLLILLGIVILLVGYLAFYSKYNDRTDELNAEIKELQTTVQELQVHYNNLDTYYAGMEAAETVIDAELEKYPSAVRYEDQVMYAIGLQKTVGMDVTSIAFSNPAVVSSFQRLSRNGDGVDAAAVTAYEYASTMTCNLTYAQLKGLISYVDKTALRTSLDNVSISFDAETGELTGSAVINQYCVGDGTEPYVPTAVPAVPLGVDDLFGTYSIHESEAEQDDQTEDGNTEGDDVTTPAS